MREFLATETAGGLLLILAAIVALVWANSPWQASYETLWHTELGVQLGRWEIELDLGHWVNDGLMAIFFLVVGLEVKRELLLGELRDRRRAALPVIAAIGGMIVPVAVYLALNPSLPESDGWGIPMATDIAFALGILALIAPSVPPAVRLFLLTLAIVDDIGAILVIAVFYTSSVELGWLAGAAGVVAAVVILRRIGFASTPMFATLGVCLWLTVYESGIHATIAGVIMGLLAPAEPELTREIVHSRTDELLDVFTPEAARETSRIARQSVSQLEWLEHQLHGWSSLVIVPLFALANAGVELTADSTRDALTSSLTLGVVLGLVLGKTIGISAASWLAVRFGWADLPTGVTWRHLMGAATLGGIGFTVSLFIAALAFEDPVLVDNAKIGVLAASVLATVPAFLLLHRARDAAPAEPG
ncbi:MAG: Na+/H+ antiporter NhaA [Acidimicrobiales bacterium]